MVKFAPGEISALDIIEIAQNPNYRTFITPFGERPQRVGGRAVPWKGVKGIDKLREINADVARGLEKAIELSRRHNEKGVALIVDEYGRMKLVPRKVAEMMRDAGKAIKIVSVSPKVTPAMVRQLLVQA